MAHIFYKMTISVCRASEEDLQPVLICCEAQQWEAGVKHSGRREDKSGFRKESAGEIKTAGER